jgi:hypothetical protein
MWRFGFRRRGRGARVLSAEGDAQRRGSEKQSGGKHWGDGFGGGLALKGHDRGEETDGQNACGSRQLPAVATSRYMPGICILSH